MGRLFGTDGVRGLANDDLTPELAFKLGRAAGFILNPAGERSAIVIGRDTRISGHMLEAALIAGICSSGVDVLTAGVIPTPAVAFLARTLDACAGVVISASHNPAPDNGIKFFNHQGFKLADEVEDRIAQLVAEGMEQLPRPTGDKLGRVIALEDAEQKYTAFLKSIIDCDLNGMRVVVDCANGAAYHVTPRLMRELGAQVVSLHDLPDGLNINRQCGSTHPESLQEAVVKFKADLGIAHDGDADRLIAVDGNGKIVDGDHILVICGLAMQKKGLLDGKVVVTVMSNMGLKNAFEKANIEVLETQVGDRYVLEKMVESGAVLGGEQSGHIIFLKHNTTGDGVLTALQLLQTIKESGRPLSELAEQMEVYPQVLINVRVKTKENWEKNAAIIKAVIEGQQELKGRGRLFVRASGTEPLIRIMAEGPEIHQLQTIAERIAEIVLEELG